MEEEYKKLRNILAQDLLERILKDPGFFEALVIKLLVAMGYGGSLNEAAGMVVGKSGDEGIDGIIKEDKLGLDNIYIQAKRWNNVVERPEVQKICRCFGRQRSHQRDIHYYILVQSGEHGNLNRRTISKSC